MSNQDFKSLLRIVPDFPIPGIRFWDVTTLFNNPEGLRELIDNLYEHYKGLGITKVVGMESRGFVVGPALAAKLGAGFVMARKPGKLPADTISESYQKEYGTDTIEIHADAISPDDVVLIHDDILATGGTVAAAERLVAKFGAKSVRVNFIIEIEELEGRSRLSSQDIYSVIKV